MKGIIGFKTITFLVLFFLVLGTSAMTIISGSVLCLTQQKCEPVSRTLLETFMNADKRIEDSVDILSNETIMSKSEIEGVPIQSLKNYHFWQIIFGLFTLFLYFYAVFWFATTFIVRSVRIESSAYIWIFITTLVILALFQILGQYMLDGTVTRLPFSGIVKLIQHPEVLFEMQSTADQLINATMNTTAVS